MIEHLARWVDPAAFAARQHAILVRGTGDRGGTLDAFASALGFPDHFGRNLDALLDCLRDLDPATTLVWTGTRQLPQTDAAGITGVLEQWQAESPQARIWLSR